MHALQRRRRLPGNNSREFVDRRPDRRYWWRQVVCARAVPRPIRRDTTSRLAGLERQHIQTSCEASNYSAHLDGGSTGAGEAIGGTSGLSVDTGYGDNPTPSDDGGTGKVVGGNVRPYGTA